MKFRIPKINVRDLMSKAYNRSNGKVTDVLMWVGTGMVLVGTGLACKATMELPGIIDNYRKEKEAIRDSADQPDVTEEESQKARKKALGKLRWKTAGKVVKLYALPAVIEGAGLVDMHCANQTLKVVNTELTGAVVTLTTAIAKIRNGIREEFGEEAEAKIMNGGWEEKEVVKVDEDGSEHVETVKVYKRDNGLPSPYARWFVYGEAEGAETSAVYNRTFLTNQQNLLQTYFRANKRVYLNDAYRMLGIKPSIAGNRVGWLYDPNRPEGDNYIDLRIQEVYREKADHPGEWEIAFLIDPNVDGPIDEKALKMGLMDE